MVLCSCACSTRIGRARSPRFCVIKLPNTSCFPRMFCIVSPVSQFFECQCANNTNGTFKGTSIILIVIAMSQILGAHLSITYLGFPAQSYIHLPRWKGGRNGMGPIRGSATQNWFKKCITEKKKLQIQSSSTSTAAVYTDRTVLNSVPSLPPM